MSRPSWDRYFMEIAETVAGRANCICMCPGAVLVKDKQIISTGYVGTPRGAKNCDEGGCPRCNSPHESGENLDKCFCCHAEENAIVQAAYHGIGTADTTIYATHFPCLNCAKMIINAGIKRVVYKQNYPQGTIDATSKNSTYALLRSCKVILDKIKD
ncbi:MAG: cytidine/deoxycytidylate deaminase family protein [Halanaerobiales bacterium]|nr:cytidine/deoxycytidylate deaminase family protein [Halanaerobiales bacterium]